MHNIIVNTYACPRCGCRFDTTRKDNLLCCPSVYCRFPVNRAHIQSYKTHSIPKALFNATAISLFEVVLEDYRPENEELCYNVADDVLRSLIREVERYS